MKTKTITLSYLNADHPRNLANNQVWRVEQVTDSTDYNPGMQLLKKQVDELCASNAWKVTIKR